MTYWSFKACVQILGGRKDLTNKAVDLKTFYFIEVLVIEPTCSDFFKKTAGSKSYYYLMMF